MKFFNYIYSDPKETKTYKKIVFFSFLFYFICNIRMVLFISQLGDVTNPFYTDMFKVNLFNFDPTLYYSGGASIIHPLYSFLVTSFGSLAKVIGGNITVLLINSSINALGVGFIYIFSKRIGVANKLAIVIAAILATTSYNVITSFVPDSYIYAQFGIILSVLYILYSKQTNSCNPLGIAVIATINFGITITNVIPYALAIITNKVPKSWGKFWQKILKSICIFLGIIAVLTIVQLLINDVTWLSGWRGSLSNGGVRYSKGFDLEIHSNLFRLMIVSPIIMPVTALIDTGIMAIVTDVSVGLGFAEGLVIVILATGFIYSVAVNYKNSILHALLCYIAWNIILHVYIGFGLATFDYDMYLYAGHYLPIIFMVLAMGLSNIRTSKYLNIVYKICLCLLVYLVCRNLLRYEDLLNLVINVYS